MLTKEMIEYLEEQKKTKYTFEEVDKYELAMSLIQNIGDQNGEIRDGLIYPCLAHLLYDKHFNEDDLEVFTKLLISNQYLHYDLENKEPYSVLKRSFVVLQLVILIAVHNRDEMIDLEIIQSVYKSFIEYFKNETDLRGYEQEVGFLHSMAHAADLFAQLMKVNSIGKQEIEEIFQLIIDKYKTKDLFFMYDEDERFVNAIMNGLERNVLDQQFVKDWITEFSTYEKLKDWPEAYYLTNNIKVFLRSLYFRTYDLDKYKYIADLVKKVLKEDVKLF